MKEKEIAAFVIDFVKGRGSALGCQLGAELHVKFPGTNFRLEYGGVRRFIDSNCHGEVVRTGTRGGDDIYSHVSNTTNEIKLTELQHPDQVTEWDVFQKPGNRLQLLVNPTSGMTKIAEEQEAVAEGMRVIPKVKGEEHLAIAKEFLRQIPPPDVTRFAAALGEDDYWRAWTRLMNSMPGLKYKSGWTAFRFDQICGLLAARLKELGVSEVPALAALERVKAVKKLKQAKNESGRSFSAAARITATLSDEELRRLAKLAIDAMGNDDLRRVWLPLGVIADALRTR